MSEAPGADRRAEQRKSPAVHQGWRGLPWDRMVNKVPGKGSQGSGNQRSSWAG